MTERTYQIADPWSGKGNPEAILDGIKVQNVRTVTLAQYRAELDAAAARAKAIAAANRAKMAR